MARTLLKKLGIFKNKDATPDLDSRLGRRIAEDLGYLKEKRLRYLAAFGGLLGRVANADGKILPSEDRRIRAILKQFTELDDHEAELVKEIIHEQTKALAGIENTVYTRELNELADADRKLEILSCLFAVAAADDEISADENESIRVIAKGLMIGQRDFVNVRSLYRDKLSVLKDLPGR